ncbi:MAG: small integral rane protein [Planctomycetota bacterium]|nr:small integral rane protein [Planctomycetota bacterium]
MLRWALIFFIIALIAGAFGFYNTEGTAMYIARFLALVFLVLFVISLIAGRRVLDGPRL